MLKRILVGLDGSDYANSASMAAIQYAKIYEATIVGLSIIDAPGIEKHLEGAPAGAIHYAEKERAHKMADAKTKAEQFLKDLKEKCDAEALRCELLSRTGSPHNIIIEESRSVDLVIVGTKTFFHYETQTGPGDTLKKILDETAAPVLAVPENMKAPENVLLTYDGSVTSAKAIRMRIHLTQKMPFHYIALHVSDDAEKSKALLAGLTKYLGAHDIDAETLNIPGDPGEVILDIAKKLMPVQVVMGAYSKSSLREWIFGSTAKALIKDGTIPLFVYH